MLKQNKFTILSQFLGKNLMKKASSIMKNIVVFTFRSFSKFPVKLICCIDFGSASTACCLLKVIGIIL